MPLLPPAPLIVDCDGVLLDYLGGFARFVAERTGFAPDPAGPDSYDMTSWVGARDKAETLSLVRAFNDPAQPAFSSLAPIAGAAEGLRLAALQGRKIHVLTSAGACPALAAARRRNLVSRFGDIFASIDVIEVGACKRDRLAAMPRGIWVEDHHANAVAGLETGHVSFLIRQRHNAAPEATCSRAALRWVDGWAEIRQALEDSCGGGA